MKNLQDKKVIYVRAEGGLSGIKGAWDKLEAKIGGPKGRKFYGAYYAQTGEYRACAALRENDNSATLDLDVGIIPGGKYADAKIYDWPAKIDKIAEVFDALATKYKADVTRPSLEFYRSQRELILYLPVK